MFFLFLILIFPLFRSRYLLLLRFLSRGRDRGRDRSRDRDRSRSRSRLRLRLRRGVLGFLVFFLINVTLLHRAALRFLRALLLPNLLPLLG